MLGIPLLRGRGLDERDGTDATATMVLSRLAAEKLFPGEDPVGRRIKVGVSDEGHDEYSEIVGVVGDVLYNRPDQGPIAEAYYSYREWGDASATVMVRTAGDPLSLMPSVRGELKALDPSLALFRVTTMDDLAADAMGDRTVVLALLRLFAAVTILLAATGTWGVVSYAVADRRKELGLRMALGAGGGRVLAMILRQSLITAILGLAVGLGGAWAGTRLLEAFLFQTSARDPRAFAAAAALLFTVVLVASYLPARRATRVDPEEALRAE
jgi:ABC-type antimicrobial peptide transport system permease subunit